MHGGVCGDRQPAPGWGLCVGIGVGVTPPTPVGWFYLRECCAGGASVRKGGISRPPRWGYPYVRGQWTQADLTP